MVSNSGGGNFFNRPQIQSYQEDCDMLFFCEKNAQTYRLCYSGAPLTSKRCSPAEKNLMLMFSQVVHRVQLIDETVKQLDSNLSKLLRRPEAPAKPEADTRIDQSQAAALLNPMGGTAETAGERPAFNIGMPVNNAAYAEAERFTRSTSTDKQSK